MAKSIANREHTVFVCYERFLIVKVILDLHIPSSIFFFKLGNLMKNKLLCSPCGECKKKKSWEM